MGKTSYEKQGARLNVALAFSPETSNPDKPTKVVRRGVYIAISIDRAVRKALATLDLADKPSSYSEFVELALARFVELGPRELEIIVDEHHVAKSLTKNKQSGSKQA